MQRKERSDKSKTIFNCEAKRKAVFTAFNAFKKSKSKEFREFTERLPHEMLKNECDALPASDREAYEIIAEKDLSRAEHLWDELKDLLKKTERQN